MYSTLSFNENFQKKIEKIKRKDKERNERNICMFFLIENILLLFCVKCNVDFFLSSSSEIS